jgi:K+-sensing histidine kinase KdpD
LPVTLFWLCCGVCVTLFQSQHPPDLALVEADENRLQQILSNLVGNAVKFTQQGQVVVFAEKAAPFASPLFSACRPKKNNGAGMSETRKK